jgi:glycosyltransferase involved in cell wall biosynthesis
VRVCLVYDCLYPYTVGGAERWYRILAERLAAEGHEVTYLTLRQWPRGTQPDLAGVTVRTVGPRLKLYSGGRRRILPPLLFGAGVLAHLVRRGRYDVVHTDAFPYFALLAASVARRRRRFALIVDWFEVWSRTYWRDYLGRVRGDIGWRVQALCIRQPQQAFCFSQLHAERLRSQGVGGPLTVLRGLYPGSDDPRGERAGPGPTDPVVVFAGRLIPEKRVAELIPAIARARTELPRLSADLFGDGPERERVAQLVQAHGLQGVVRIHGFVEAQRVDRALGEATCVVLLSSREGYGLIVLEASARGTPSIVVAAPDNAATELIEEGVNGVVASSADPATVAAAIVTVHGAGERLRRSTREWFARNVGELALESSLEAVAAAYARGRA